MDYKKLFLLIYLIFSVVIVYSQCCSQGTPLAGTANAGVLSKNNLRINTFYRYSYADKYYNVNKPVEYNFLKSSSYNFAGTTIGYGLTSRLTTELEIGYFISKKQIINLDAEEKLSGSGFNNSVISFKYSLYYNKDKNVEITAGAGVKIPFETTPKFSENVMLPAELQPSTLAYGNVMHLFIHKKLSNDFNLYLVNRNEINYKNNLNYKYGNSYIAALFITKNLYKDFNGIIQTRYEYKTKSESDGVKLTNTGGHIGFVSPQISFNPNVKWSFSAMADLPVFRHYQGIQLGNKYSLAFSVSRNFCF